MPTDSSSRSPVPFPSGTYSHGYTPTFDRTHSAYPHASHPVADCPGHLLVGGTTISNAFLNNSTKRQFVSFILPHPRHCCLFLPLLTLSHSIPSSSFILKFLPLLGFFASGSFHEKSNLSNIGCDICMNILFCFYIL